MSTKRILIITLFIFFSSFTNIAYSETLNFGASTYEGEVKKGKAHGVGILTFSDGTKYEGKFKKNKMHGKGKYTDLEGNVFEGKWRRGKFRNKIDKKTREVIKLTVDAGKTSSFQMRGQGSMSSKWYEAERNSSGYYELTAKGKRDMEKDIEADKPDGGGGDSGGGGGC